MSVSRSQSLSLRGACLLMAGVNLARGTSFLFSKHLMEGMGPTASTPSPSSSSRTSPGATTR